ncbi:MAG: glycosyltransferase family 2 protein [Candidatus Doudnabacteria bacterium]|nr:glycosyltransferase family 2 protein [Candidatus Doudnabacteria bacterium]
MTLSIIIPVYNESETLEAVLEKVNRADTNGFEKEIIIIDDGSNPSLRKSDFNGYLFIKHSKNLGKGAAIKTGLGLATGDIVLIQDADLEYEPQDFPSLLSPFSDPNVQAVYGYRTKPGYKSFYFGNKLFTGFVNMLFGSNLRDPYSGYKAIKKPLLDSLQLVSDKFEIEAEITSKLLKKKVKILQVPIAYYPRTFEKGKKIKFFKDGGKGLWTFLKYRFLK